MEKEGAGMASHENSLTARVTFSVQASCPDGTPEDFRAELERQLDIIMEELLGDDHVVDPLVTTEFSTGTIVVELMIEDVDDLEDDDVIKTASVAIRSAIHAADGFTPGWGKGKGTVVREHAAVWRRLSFGAELVDA